MLFLYHLIFITLFKNGKDRRPLVLFADWPPSKNVDSLLLSATWAFSATICHLYPDQLLSKCHSNPVLLKETVTMYCFKSKLTESSKVKTEEQRVESLFRRHFNPTAAKRNAPSTVKGPAAHKVNVSQS